MKYTIKSESNRKRASILWEKYEHQFPRFSPTMSFFAFSRTMRNWWGNPCISHMMKYTIGWESNGKKAPILWEKYEYQFPRLSHTMGFVAFSCTVGNLWGNPCTSHMMTSINFFLCELSDKFLAENNGHILFQKQLVVSYRIYV